MNRELKISIQIIVAAIFIALFVFSTITQAQVSSFTASIIGGKTEGVKRICCNGVIVGFESINNQNPWILDDDAILTPGVSETYREGNEMTQGYYTVGLLAPVQTVCLNPADDCAPDGEYPQILTVGTGGAPATGI